MKRKDMEIRTDGDQHRQDANSSFRFFAHVVSLRGFASCCALIILAGVAVPAQERSMPDGVLERLSNFVGGEWVSSAKLPSGQPVARFVHTHEHGGKVLRTRGRVGATPVESVIGWDPVAGKTYYVDRHGAGTVYFGYLHMEGEETVVEFQSLTGKPTGWKAREKFIGKDGFQTVMTPAGGQEGKDSQKVTLNRVALTEPAPAPAVDPNPEDPDRNLSRLALLIGGVWKSEAKDPSGKPFAELRYSWGPGRKTILGTGAIAGSPVESVIGWDSVALKPYYLDHQGPQTVYFGHYTIHDEDVTVDFRSLVGRPGQFRTSASFPDSDTYMATIRPLKDGQVGQGHKVKLIRTK